VRDIALQVPRHAAGNAEKAHAHDGHLQLGDGGLQGGRSDQVGRGRHQPDAAGHGEKSQQRGQGHAPRKAVVCTAGGGQAGKLPRDASHETPPAV